MSKQPDVMREVRKRLHRALNSRSVGIRLNLKEGELVMHGHLETYYEKQLAQEAVRRVNGIDHVVNEIEVA